MLFHFRTILEFLFVGGEYNLEYTILVLVIYVVKNCPLLYLYLQYRTFSWKMIKSHWKSSICHINHGNIFCCQNRHENLEKAVQKMSALTNADNWFIVMVNSKKKKKIIYRLFYYRNVSKTYRIYRVMILIKKSIDRNKICFSRMLPITSIFTEKFTITLLNINIIL